MPDVGCDQFGGRIRQEVVEVGVVETVDDFTLDDGAQIAEVDDDAAVVEFTDDGHFEPIAVAVQVLARARVPLKLMSGFKRKGASYARAHALRLLRLAVGIARRLVALHVIVLDTVPYVLHINVCNYLTTLGARLEFDGFVTDRANGTVARLNAAFDRSTFGHA